MLLLSHEFSNLNFHQPQQDFWHLKLTLIDFNITETESKLSATQENMGRLDDIIYELDGQLTPLRAQRDVALKFREFDDKRAKLEISDLDAQIIAEKVSYESAQAQFKEVQQT